MSSSSAETGAATGCDILGGITTNCSIMDTPPRTYAVPAAIIIAGLLVASALYFRPAAPTRNSAGDAPTITLKDIPPVTIDDHVRGPADAPITIIEYSDLECPFCKEFHTALQSVAADPAAPKFRLVYRHFPLTDLHARATREAEATECAAEQGGNEAFWSYVDRLFAVTPSNDQLDPAEVSRIAGAIGLDVGKFEQCLTAGTYADRVSGEADDAVMLGAQGTPFSLIIGPDKKVLPLGGYIPAEDLKQLLTGLTAEN